MDPGVRARRGIERVGVVDPGVGVQSRRSQGSLGIGRDELMDPGVGRGRGIGRGELADPSISAARVAEAVSLGIKRDEARGSWPRCSPRSQGS